MPLQVLYNTVMPSASSLLPFFATLGVLGAILAMKVRGDLTGIHGSSTDATLQLVLVVTEG